MRAIMLTLSAVLLCQSAAAVDTAQSIDHLATHHQTGVIQIADGGQSLNINAFCLDSHGQIVAACGEGPGEIRSRHLQLCPTAAGRLWHEKKGDLRVVAPGAADASIRLFR